MKENYVIDGMLYEVEYKPELSNSDYTQHKVYHIKTEEKNYPKAKKAIAAIMNDSYKQDIWDKGLYLIKNKREPSMLNAFHIYYEFSYNEDLDVYIYTYVRPYDD